jgi:hypothetical protein
MSHQITMSLHTIIYDAQDTVDEEKLLDTTEYQFAPTVAWSTCMTAYNITYDIRIKGQPATDIHDEKQIYIFLMCGTQYINLGQLCHTSLPCHLSAYYHIKDGQLKIDTTILADVHAAQQLLSYMMHGYATEPPVIFGMSKNDVLSYLLCVDPHMPCLEKLHRVLKMRKISNEAYVQHGEPEPGQ